MKKPLPALVVHVDDLGGSVGELYENVPIRSWNPLDTADREIEDAKDRIMYARVYKEVHSGVPVQN